MEEALGSGGMRQPVGGKVAAVVENWISSESIADCRTDGISHKTVSTQKHNG